MEGLQLVWGWQPALYLFFGGTGAGGFVVSAVFSLYEEGKNRRALNVSMWASAGCLIVGLLLLLGELTNPVRGMLLWQSFSNWSSWMTFGAWVVFCAVTIFVLMATLTSRFVRKRFGLSWEKEGVLSGYGRLCKALSVVGILLGLCVAIYTGVLLMLAPGVPFWKTLLLPCLFTVSALDTGVALVELVAAVCSKKGEIKGKSGKLLVKSIVALVLAEALVAVAFFATMLSGNVGSSGGSESFERVAVSSAELLVIGELAPFFWGLFVFCGLIVPLIVAVANMQNRSEGVFPPPVFGAVAALVGGCALRFLVLFAGGHVDFVADAMMSLGI